MLDKISFLWPAYWTFGTNLPLGAIPAHFAHLSWIFGTCGTCSATSSAGALEHIHCHSWSYVGLVCPLFGNGMYLPIFINSKLHSFFLFRFLRWPIVYPLFLLIHLGYQLINQNYLCLILGSFQMWLRLNVLIKAIVLHIANLTISVIRLWPWQWNFTHRDILMLNTFSLRAQ